ncbi:hypothetical protein [Consotaella aegiceratis]|uniref:hypothetical protein n=1 Tax=Consotaella aegiceratis TaxID=3097961 RepID=UPI002F408586
MEDMNAAIGEILQNEFPRNYSSDTKRNLKPVVDNKPTSSPRLPRQIPGGFGTLGDDLDRRARDWRNMVRVLEQQRPQLELAESEHERLYEALARVVPEVQETGRQLRTMIENATNGEMTGDLAGQFNKSLGALDKLESVAETLTSNLLFIRSTWEQYARSALQAQKMREELK